MQMSMYQFWPIQQMIAILKVGHFDTLHECKTWVRVPLLAP